MPFKPLIPRSDRARFIDLLGSASLLAGILGSAVNVEGKKGTSSEFVESYFLEVFCKVKSREGADGTTADDGDALGRGGGHSVYGGRSRHFSGTEIPEIPKSGVSADLQLWKLLKDPSQLHKRTSVSGDCMGQYSDLRA